MRSMEGTLAMFLASGLVMAPILAGSGELGWHQAVAFSLITATVAASVEAGSAYGADNLTCRSRPRPPSRSYFGSLSNARQQ